MSTPRPEPAAGPDLAEAPPPALRRGPRRLLGPSLLLAVLAGASLVAWLRPAEVAEAWRAVAGTLREPAPPTAPAPPRPHDGSLALTPQAREALGLETAEVRPQAEPIRLELLGTTDYISDTLTKVRPLFKGRVDRVHATVGQPVKKGDPLVDLYSTELAEAKRNYEIERIQWLYDRKLLEIREELLRSRAVSQQLYDETKNNEMKNRREYEVARDKLLVYGLTEEEVGRVEREEGSQKARMTLRSPADGLVIDRDVAVGNLYDENDTLLVIAPLERLWVWGNVFESDLDLVRPGLAWEIEFPFLRYKVRGEVEYVSNRVDPATHAVRIRTSVPNPEGKLKADMLVRGMLEIPPVPGRVVIPRAALVVGDRPPCVYVEASAAPGRFERRAVTVAHEKADHAVIDGGLRPGERVATVGALVLDQMDEDRRAVAGPGPPDRHPRHNSPHRDDREAPIP